MSLTDLLPNRNTEELIARLKSQNAILSKQISIVQKKVQSFKLVTDLILEYSSEITEKPHQRLYVLEMPIFGNRKVICQLKNLSKRMDQSSLYRVNVCILCISRRRSLFFI